MNLCFVLSYCANEAIINNLKKYGKVILVYPNKNLAEPVCCHADMQITQIDRRSLVYSKSINPTTLEELKNAGITMYEGNRDLTLKYPGNIAYNVLKVGRNIYHNTKFTDCVVKDIFEKIGCNFIYVKQGYAGCSSIYIKDFILTTDEGIEKKARTLGDKCFYFNGDDIILKGYNRGFIGGSSGYIEDLGLLLTGTLDKLKEGNKVRGFLEKENINVIELSDMPIEDIGGIQIYKL